jgi:hypothetical protein
MPSSLEAAGFQPGDGRLESHQVFLEQARVTFSYDNAIYLPTVDSRSLPVSGFVSPGGGLTVTPVEIIDASMAARLGQKLPMRDVDNPFPGAGLIAKVELRGKTADGTEVSTNELQFPITICRGCLLQFPAEADDTSDFSPGLDCNDVSKDVSSRPCRLGQDEPVDCRLCKRAKPQSEADQAQCDPM